MKKKENIQELEEKDYSDEDLIFDPNDLDDKRLFKKQTLNQLTRDDDEVKDFKEKKPGVQLQYEEKEEVEDRKKQQIAF
ncbi:unnamed protein product [Paramecium sonneborni]|uniref:Uncharacterized protein n=1 Tax=Paramecium sonneborni TaxID=65129 RepID=A0A8S1PIM7_9CILI|nr:unnamed protein product [Paramecium sonneborni]